MYDDNIVIDAYYLINKFNSDKKMVTNLQIQKLMYFFEAYYMNIYDVEKLYDCYFNAWAYGPVAIPLYKEFRRFGSGEIKLNDEESKKGYSISTEKKHLLDKLYDVFKDISPMRLVEYTHMVGSPWEKVWKKNGQKVGYGADTRIDKLESKKWFKKVFGKKE